MSKASVLKELIKSYADKKDKLNEISKVIEQEKKELYAEVIPYMKKLDKKELEFTVKESSETVKYKCVLIINRSVNFDIEGIEKSLDKETAREIINKDYSILDMDGLVNLLKAYNVPFKDFKKLIDVRKSVNINALDNMYELGLIKAEDIEKYTEVSENSGYLKVTKI